MAANGQKLLLALVPVLENVNRCFALFTDAKAFNCLVPDCLSGQKA
jgi:hypothetical protein